MLLILGAAMFFGHGDHLNTFGALYGALSDNRLAGAVASPLLATLFAVALLASGQNSTITGTLTGQIVMEGFIHMRVPMWLRRLITRVTSIIPVMICTVAFGGRESALDNLLVYSQVFLSVALPISMIPLMIFTSSSKIMGERFLNPTWMIVVGWAATALLTVLNLQLIWTTIAGIF